MRVFESFFRSYKGIFADMESRSRYCEQILSEDQLFYDEPEGGRKSVSNIHSIYAPETTFSRAFSYLHLWHSCWWDISKPLRGLFMSRACTRTIT